MVLESIFAIIMFIGFIVGIIGAIAIIAANKKSLQLILGGFIFIIVAGPMAIAGFLLLNMLVLPDKPITIVNTPYPNLNCLITTVPFVVVILISYTLYKAVEKSRVMRIFYEWEHPTYLFGTSTTLTSKKLFSEDVKEAQRGCILASLFFCGSIILPLCMLYVLGWLFATN